MNGRRQAGNQVRRKEEGRKKASFKGRKKEGRRQGKRPRRSQKGRQGIKKVGR